MQKLIKAFPIISDELCESLNIEIKDKFNNGFLIENSVNGEIVLLDSQNDNSYWQFDFGDLKLDREIIIRNPRFLFGTEGVACENSKLGIGLRWSSKDSRSRGVIDMGTIEYSSKSISLSLPKIATFTRNTIRNYLVLETIIYIKDSGKPTSNEMFLANEKGIVLGELDIKKIRLNGDASELPIYEEDQSDKKSPLWRVIINIDNPHEDMFRDSFQIYLNKNNPSFYRVDRSLKESYDPHLMDEIVASALSLLVCELRESDYWSEIEENDSQILDESVSYVVHHFIDKLNIQTTNTVSINESFRKVIENLEN